MRAIHGIALLLVLGLFPVSARADAKSGFGFFLAGGDLVSKDSDTEEEFANATYGGGFDYQLALGKSFSLGAAIAEVTGDASFPTLPGVGLHKISTQQLEARIWFGPVLAGYHVGS